MNSILNVNYSNEVYTLHGSMMKDATAEHADMPNKILFQIRRLNKIKSLFQRCNNSNTKVQTGVVNINLPKCFQGHP